MENDPVIASIQLSAPTTAYMRRNKHLQICFDFCSILPPSFILHDQNKIQGCETSKIIHWKNKSLFPIFIGTKIPYVLIGLPLNNQKIILFHNLESDWTKEAAAASHWKHRIKNWSRLEEVTTFGWCEAGILCWFNPKVFKVNYFSKHIISPFPLSSVPV